MAGQKLESIRLFDRSNNNLNDAIHFIKSVKQSLYQSLSEKYRPGRFLDRLLINFNEKSYYLGTFLALSSPRQ